MGRVFCDLMWKLHVQLIIFVILTIVFPLATDRVGANSWLLAITLKMLNMERMNNGPSWVLRRKEICCREVGSTESGKFGTRLFECFHVQRFDVMICNPNIHMLHSASQPAIACLGRQSDRTTIIYKSIMRWSFIRYVNFNSMQCTQTKRTDGAPTSGQIAHN